MARDEQEEEREFLADLEARGHTFTKVGRKGEVKYGYVATAVIDPVSTMRITSACRAPSATLMPISLFRWATAKFIVA